MRLRSFWSVLLAIIMFAGAALWVWIDSRSYMASELGLPQSPYRFSVSAGTNLASIVVSLRDAGIIEHPRYFTWEARRLGVAEKIKAGDYEIKSGITPRALLDMLVEGRGVRYSIMIMEGVTVKDILQRLKSHPQLTHSLESVKPDEVLAKIGKTGTSPEGLFFPDTYFFQAGTLDADILRQAFDRMKLKLEQAWVSRDSGLPYKSSYDALVMASIIEKETGVKEERSQIAGVFVRRLQKDMLLQTDPTVIYALADAFDGNLRREHLQLDSPYNTYRHKGLTPSPIAAPSEASIYAALHPAPGDALFFVARGDGSHQFSATLSDHNEAVSKLQRNGR